MKNLPIRSPNPRRTKTHRRPRRHPPGPNPPARNHPVNGRKIPHHPAQSRHPGTARRRRCTRVQHQMGIPRRQLRHPLRRCLSRCRPGQYRRTETNHPAARRPGQTHPPGPRRRTRQRTAQTHQSRKRTPHRREEDQEVEAFAGDWGRGTAV